MIELFASIQTCELGWFLIQSPDIVSFIRQGVPIIPPSIGWDEYLTLPAEHPAVQVAPAAKFERVTDEYMRSLLGLIERSLAAPKDVWRLMRVIAFYYDLKAEAYGGEKFTRSVARIDCGASCATQAKV